MYALCVCLEECVVLDGNGCVYGDRGAGGPEIVCVLVVMVQL